MTTTPAIPYHRVGSSADEHQVVMAFWNGCAGYICGHTESKQRPCPNCMHVVELLIKPIIRFVRNAALGNREEGPLGKADGYASMGAALDLFLKEVNNVVGLARHSPAQILAYQKTPGPKDPTAAVYGRHSRVGPGGSSQDHGAPQPEPVRDLPGRPDTVPQVSPQSDGAGE